MNIRYLVLRAEGWVGCAYGGLRECEGRKGRSNLVHVGNGSLECGKNSSTLRFGGAIVLGIYLSVREFLTALPHYQPNT